MSSPIEKAIQDEDWEQARDLIKGELERSPDSHWLLTRLGLTYYEQRDYATALRYHQESLDLAPNCPLALWDYAGALQMLDRPQEALQVFQQLAGAEVDALAYGDCGEGRAWAKGLIADCHYRMSGCYEALAQPDAALQELEIHLNLRGPGCRSIYSLTELRKKHKQGLPAA